ncbi:hypothetical protein Fot_32607 [Forsythia ovata]|uniref:Uncharacterized protein n=1 Tax=Forsythia ovata TaxID=205694 RepID=A0ABD1T8F3_9LAMI
MPLLMCFSSAVKFGKRPRPALVRLSGTKPWTLQLGSLEDSRQKKTIEEISRETAQEEAERAGDEDANGDEVSLVRKRKASNSQGVRRREKAEAEAAKLLVANFYHTKAYTNFSNFFSSMGHQEVIAALQSKHPNLDVASLEAKFLPMDIEDDGDD